MVRTETLHKLRLFFLFLPCCAGSGYQNRITVWIQRQPSLTTETQLLLVWKVSDISRNTCWLHGLKQWILVENNKPLVKKKKKKKLHCKMTLTISSRLSGHWHHTLQYFFRAAQGGKWEKKSRALQAFTRYWKRMNRECFSSSFLSQREN